MFQLSEPAQRLKLEYQREWRKKHQNLIKAYQVRYWEKKAAELNQNNENYTINFNETGSDKK